MLHVNTNYSCVSPAYRMQSFLTSENDQIEMVIKRMIHFLFRLWRIDHCQNLTIPSLYFCLTKFSLFYPTQVHFFIIHAYAYSTKTYIFKWNIWNTKKKEAIEWSHYILWCSFNRFNSNGRIYSISFCQCCLWSYRGHMLNCCYSSVCVCDWPGVGFYILFFLFTSKSLRSCSQIDRLTRPLIHFIRIF